MEKIEFLKTTKDRKNITYATILIRQMATGTSGKYPFLVYIKHIG
jgi:hypothetical protein